MLSVLTMPVTSPVVDQPFFVFIKQCFLFTQSLPFQIFYSQTTHILLIKTVKVRVEEHSSSFLKSKSVSLPFKIFHVNS